MNEVLKIEHLSHIYSAGTPFEKKAVDDVSFSAQRGEFIGLIGHTGSGKSTLIQHFNGLLKPTSGKIYINGVKYKLCADEPTITPGSDFSQINVLIPKAKFPEMVDAIKGFDATSIIRNDLKQLIE